eukprot:1184429-Prorocentrum_minimum.AAC.2
MTLDRPAGPYTLADTRTWGHTPAGLSKVVRSHPPNLQFNKNSDPYSDILPSGTVLASTNIWEEFNPRQAVASAIASKVLAACPEHLHKVDVLVVAPCRIPLLRDTLRELSTDEAAIGTEEGLRAFARTGMAAIHK